MGKRKASAASEIDNVETLRNKLVEAEAKKSAKQPKSRASKSGGKSARTKAKAKDSDDLGSGEENRNPQGDPASSKRTILVK
jgi:hypothetical protein